ncbi:antigen 5 like allergen Cul n 1-like [Drosophila gunungcola]|nr:antigen 5 like allergen Cul n 1-like [Drosophila gunungcola]
MQLYILSMHNSLRSIAAAGTTSIPRSGRMLKLSWDTALEKVASLLVMECALHHGRHCLSTEDFDAPGVNTAYRKFKRRQEPFKIIRSQINAWYDENKYLEHQSLQTASFKSEKETGHFLNMMVNPSSDLGCAVALTQKNGYYQQWLVCLYSCSPKQAEPIWEFRGHPGSLCIGGVDPRHSSLCDISEPVENCRLLGFKEGRSAIAPGKELASVIRSHMASHP